MEIARGPPYPSKKKVTDGGFFCLCSYPCEPAERCPKLVFVARHSEGPYGILPDMGSEGERGVVPSRNQVSYSVNRAPDFLPSSEEEVSNNPMTRVNVGVHKHKLEGDQRTELFGEVVHHFSYVEQHNATPGCSSHVHCFGLDEKEEHYSD